METPPQSPRSRGRPPKPASARYVGIKVWLPPELAARVKQLFPERHRSEAIAQAIARLCEEQEKLK